MTQRQKIALVIVFLWFPVNTSWMAESTEGLPPLSDIAILLDIHENYCPATPRCPLESTDYRLTEAYKTSCCEDCSCDLETCAVRGTCCPNTLEYFPTVEESRIKRSSRAVCGLAHLRQPTETIPPGLGFMMFRNCADDFIGPVVIDKCEHNTEGQPLTYDVLLPVTDTETRLTYRNRFCAECNHVSVAESHLIPWNVAVECSSGSSLFVTMETAINKVLTSNFCNLVYKKPSGPAGEMAKFCLPTVDECNVTGNWDIFNSYIERACYTYEIPFKNVIDDTLYGNVFCYMCNEPRPPITYCPSPDGTEGNPTPIMDIMVSFSTILQPKSVHDNTHQENDSVLTTCQESEIPDPLKGTCRAVRCLPPKKLSNGTCTDMYSSVVGVPYEVFVKVTLSKPITKSAIVDVVWQIEMLSMYNIFGYLTDSPGFFYIFYSQAMNSESSEHQVDFLVCHIRTGAMTEVLPFLNNMLELDGENETIGANDDLQVRFDLEVYTVDEGPDEAILRTRDGANLSYYLTLFGEPDPDPGSYQVITKVNGCPLVDISDYITEYLPNGDLLVAELDFAFPAKAFTEEGNRSLMVCSDDFLSLAEKQLRLKQPYTSQFWTDNAMALGILSFIMTVLSLICLLLTLLTYSMFKVLQTQPGLNNMCLAGCLIVAQSLYQFGTGQAGEIAVLSCQIIGILTHFFWLMSVFWMNVCSFHMFRVFSSLTVVTHIGSVTRRTVLYTVYCFLSSAVWVIVNIVVTAASSRGVELGYGGSLCYVSDYYMNLYTFVLPVGIVVLVNLGMLIAVIVKVSRLPTMVGNTPTNRNFVGIYVKLSCVTGVAWLFGFLVYTGVVVFEYLFIICNAGQGVYIFISFVCNSRVLELYRNLLKGKQLNTETSRSSRSTKQTDDQVKI